MSSGYPPRRYLRSKYNTEVLVPKMICVTFCAHPLRIRVPQYYAQHESTVPRRPAQTRNTPILAAPLREKLRGDGCSAGPITLSISVMGHRRPMQLCRDRQGPMQLIAVIGSDLRRGPPPCPRIGASLGYINTLQELLTAAITSPPSSDVSVLPCGHRTQIVRTAPNKLGLCLHA